MRTAGGDDAVGMQNTTPQEVNMFAPVQPMRANGKGALNGYVTKCECCGLVLRSSLHSALRADMTQHADYHARKEARS